MIAKKASGAFISNTYVTLSMVSADVVTNSLSEVNFNEILNQLSAGSIPHFLLNNKKNYNRVKR